MLNRIINLPFGLKLSLVLWALLILIGARLWYLGGLEMLARERLEKCLVFCVSQGYRDEARVHRVLPNVCVCFPKAPRDPIVEIPLG